MTLHLIKRLLLALPTLLVLSLILFLLVKAIPGDPAQMLLGDRGSSEALAQLRAEMGLDQPILVQYWNYLRGILMDNDWGTSIVTGEPIAEILAQKFPATAELALLAMLLAVLVGVPLGLLAARFPSSWVDTTTMTTAVVGVSMPVFWLGLMLMWLFGLYLGWLPLSGRLSIELDYVPTTGLLLVDAIFVYRDPELFMDGLKHLILPALTLSSIPSAFLARITRNAMLDILSSDFVRTARAKGASKWLVYMKHSFKNASIPISTIFGLQFGTLLGGAVITETIFAWPGMGRWILDSVSARDITAIEGGILVGATGIVVVNTLVDITYQLLDPRVSDA